MIWRSSDHEKKKKWRFTSRTTTARGVRAAVFFLKLQRKASEFARRLEAFFFFTVDLSFPLVFFFMLN